jgi:hypothetical protein
MPLGFTIKVRGAKRRNDWLAATITKVYKPSCAGITIIRARRVMVPHVMTPTQSSSTGMALRPLQTVRR